eukprot:TRINITY_DN14424_c0_g1_i2.p2 TRINITY_DN14424_c0_g1~~TRINITY_DN14424_c0_g1_i2.p2  ORF type:complete len:116 (+),score=34.56 TRINITY_DN14424_c0_g1_i2:462-809(+)
MFFCEDGSPAEWACGVGPEPVMDAFNMEHVLARRDLVQLLLDLKISKAHTALRISLFQFLLKNDCWKLLSELPLQPHFNRQSKDCGFIDCPWMQLRRRDIGVSPSLEVKEIKQEE